MSRSGTIKYHSLDAYRFIAAMGVLAFHYLYDFKLISDPAAPFAASLPVMVDFFFVLSGFVIAVSYRDRMTGGRDYLRFLRARFARIYPLHLATFALMAVAALVASRLAVPLNHPEALGLDGVAPSLALVHAWGVIDHLAFNAPSWSLSAEFFVYLLAPAAFWAARRLSFAGGLALVLAALAAIETARALTGARSIMLATYDLGMMRALPSFFAGVVVAFALPRWVAARPAWARWGVAHLLGAAILAGLWLAAPAAALTALFAMLIVVAAVCEAQDRPSLLRGPAMRTLGDMSFAVYMLHGLAIIPAGMALRRLGLMDGGVGSAAGALIATALVLVASYACHRWFEVPARRALSEGRAPRASAPIAAE